jgi:hypothetical protein
MAKKQDTRSLIHCPQQLETRHWGCHPQPLKKRWMVPTPAMHSPALVCSSLTYILLRQWVEPIFPGEEMRTQAEWWARAHSCHGAGVPGMDSRACQTTVPQPLAGCPGDKGNAWVWLLESSLKVSAQIEFYCKDVFMLGKDSWSMDTPNVSCEFSWIDLKSPHSSPHLHCHCLWWCHKLFRTTLLQQLPNSSIFYSFLPVPCLSEMKIWLLSTTACRPSVTPQLSIH